VIEVPGMLSEEEWTKKYCAPTLEAKATEAEDLPSLRAIKKAVQITGHDYLRSLGVELVPTSAPDFFTTDTPTAVLVRQVLGAVSQFEKANLVA
jgi:hypothetical protein